MAACRRSASSFPACNEEAAIEKCIQSLLAQDYPALKVVAINDRSTDRTGEIIQRLAVNEPRLVAREIKTLPDGWLGKNHANFVGAGATDSDWILFTDGDIMFERDALSKAVTAGRARAAGSSGPHARADSRQLF